MNTTAGATPPGSPMSGADCRDSLWRYYPQVHIDGRLIESLAAAPELPPGSQRAGHHPRLRA